MVCRRVRRAVPQFRKTYMVENKAGSSAEEAKKLEELDTNLEKHYIAGLRMRDGRTIGLGGL